MNLDEFKNRLDTDARGKVSELESENASLKRERKNLLELLAERDKYIQMLEEQNERLRARGLEPFRGIEIDFNNPNALSTLAMLGAMVGK